MQKTNTTGYPEIPCLFQRRESLHPGLWISKLTQALTAFGRVHLMVLVGYQVLALTLILNYLRRHHVFLQKGAGQIPRTSRITCRQLIMYSACMSFSQQDPLPIFISPHHISQLQEKTHGEDKSLPNNLVEKGRTKPYTQFCL